LDSLETTNEPNYQCWGNKLTPGVLQGVTI
jgi:hypothetical protein